MNSKKQTTKEVKYRNCKDCKEKMIYVPRRPKCIDCYKKTLNKPVPNAIDLFIPDSDEETKTVNTTDNTTSRLKDRYSPRPTNGFMHDFD